MSTATARLPIGLRRCAAALMPLALLCAAGTVQAQLDYSYQAVLDFSYGRFEPSGFYRKYRFNSNSLSASFVGATASYGLDGGWTPGATVETFLRFQDFKTGRKDSDPLLSRNAFVFLNSPYGRLRVGRLQTLLFDATARFNALGNSIAFSPALRQAFGNGNLIGVQGDFYWDSAVGYTSPNFDGTTFNLISSRGERSNHGDLNSANVVVSHGLLAAALTAQHVHINNGYDDPTDETAWQLGLNYNLGPAQLFATWLRTHDPGLGVNSWAASAGLSWIVGPGSVVLQMGQAHATGVAIDRKQTSVAAGYIYAYDSQIDLYVLTLNDRVSRQTSGVSWAVGVRGRF
ncbi:porin [Roseateles saccharophilus]|nr:porin [Roseateles saccharophilus]